MLRLFPIKRHPIKEEDDDELDERPTVHEEEMWCKKHIQHKVHMPLLCKVYVSRV
jgi:hypothetical protein